MLFSKMGGNFIAKLSTKITVLVTPGIPVYVSVMPWLSTEAYMSGKMKFTASEGKIPDDLEVEKWGGCEEEEVEIEVPSMISLE